MSIGRTFKESFQKALRSLETDRYGFGSDGNLKLDEALEAMQERQREAVLESELITAREDRIFYIRAAFRYGWDIQKVHKLTNIDPWFLNQLYEIFHAEMEFREDFAARGLTRDNVRRMKELGFSDRQLGFICSREELQDLFRKGPTFQRKYAIKIKEKENTVRKFRKEHGIIPVSGWLIPAPANSRPTLPITIHPMTERTRPRPRQTGRS
jgi:carbamoyl-phosphate synthase large subunit